MEILKDQAEYVVRFKSKELQSIWWILNEYLIDGTHLKENDPELYQFATKYLEEFEFVCE